MLIRLGEIIQDAREYKEVTRAELDEYAGVSEELIEKIEEDHTIDKPNYEQDLSRLLHTS